MIDAKIEAALNDQINHEIRSSYNYLAMAAYFDQRDLIGFAGWMYAQREEELQHAMRLTRYLIDRDGKLSLEAIAEPKSNFQTAKEVFEAALETERSNTKAIETLYALATELNDYRTQSHLQWFLDEQVEEEASVEELLNLVTLAGDNPAAILQLNQQLMSRKPSAIPMEYQNGG